jgi:rod shape-determining protein MreC
MLSFLRRHKGAVAGAVIFLVSAVLIAFPSLGGALPKKGRGVLLDVLSPVQEFVSFVIENVRRVGDHYILLTNKEEENDELKRLVEELSAKYDNLKTLYIETDKKNRRLEEILGFAKESSYELMPARVVGRDASITSRSIVVDKGYRDGVTLNMPVISVSGIVGMVQDVSPNASRVMLISDKNSRIDVLIQQDRVLGILEGSADGNIRVSYVDGKIPVTQGDVVVTAGVGGIFPKGLLVGEVTKVKKPVSELFLEIEVSPRTDLGSLEEVLLIIGER